MTFEQIWSYLWRFLFYTSLFNEQLLPAALKYSRAEYPKSWKSAAKMPWILSSRWQGTWLQRWRYSWLGLPSRWRATTPPGSLGWRAGMKLCMYNLHQVITLKPFQKRLERQQNLVQGLDLQVEGSSRNRQGMEHTWRSDCSSEGLHHLHHG